MMQGPWHPAWLGFDQAGSAAEQVSPMFGPLYSEGGDEPVRRPYGDVALPLGVRLALAIKEKIWRREYIDLFSLHSESGQPRYGLGDC